MAIAPKKINYDVAIKSTNHTRSYSLPPEVYTSDTAVQFRFNILDVEAAEFDEGAAVSTVEITTRDGSFFQHVGETSLEGTTVVYDLKEAEGNHAGLAKIQLKINLGGDYFTSDEYEFKIINSIATGVPVEIYVQNWETLTAQANAYLTKMAADIEDFDVALETGVLATNIAAKLMSLETTYAPEIVSMRAQLEHIVTVDIKKYGALMNGADDSAILQSAVDAVSALGGGVILIPKGTLSLYAPIILKSNVKIMGTGWHSRIKSIYPSGSPYGINLFQGYEIENVVISDLMLENTGWARGGSWTPRGTMDGAGCGVAIGGSNNIVIKDCYTYNTGGANNGTGGVGGVWLSCCTNSKIIDNTMELGNNAICVDRWFAYYMEGVEGEADRSGLYNHGVIISGNTTYNMTGRGVAIENINGKGSMVITGNTFNSFKNAAIEGRDFTDCIISDNICNGDNTGSPWGGIGLGLNGIDIVNTGDKVIISNNQILNVRDFGIRGFNCTDFIITGNRINNVTTLDGIFIKNVETEGVGYNMVSGIISNNIINNVRLGILIKEDNDATTLSNVVVTNNVITFREIGIELDYPRYFNVTGNVLVPVVTFGITVGIRAITPFRCVLSNNIIKQCNKAYHITADAHSVISSGMLEGNTTALTLNACVATAISNVKIRGGTTAFDMVNGSTSTSNKVRANCEIADTTTIKNGNGIIVTYRTGVKPTTAITDIGDKAENTAPSAGGYLGWVCVASNSANWKGYGLIEV